MAYLKKPSQSAWSGFVPALLPLIVTLGASAAQANDLLVNALTDSAVAADGRCTLREAINNANTNADSSGGDCATGSGADNINFSVSGTVSLGAALPAVADAAGLVIDGGNQSITVSGNHTTGTTGVRILQVNAGAALTVNRLTIANGYGGVGFAGQGSGILNNGTLNVGNSTFTGNVSSSSGGAIANLGSLTVANSTFTGNMIAAGFGSGGAIYSASSGTLSVANSTIVGNYALTPACPPGVFCTQSIATAGGISGSNFTTPTQFDNNIVTGNFIGGLGLDGITITLGAPDDVRILGLIGTNNLFGSAEGSSFPNGTTGNSFNVPVASVLNTALASNGGPTQTLALLASGPAIDTGNAAVCAGAQVNNLDQRGTARPQGAACDIGAFEFVPSADLALSGSVSPNPVDARDLVKFVLTVVNNGAANATNVTLVDTLPVSGLTSVTSSASQGTCGAPVAGKITCNLGSLANGASASVTIQGITATAGTLNNTAVISGDQPDSNSANNTGTQTVTVQALLCRGLVPTIVGTPGNDTITGTRRRDVIHGLGGNDTISGGTDNDVICGGEGNDTLRGDDGSDYLNGGAGTDSCNGGKGTDSGVNCEISTAIP